MKNFLATEFKKESIDKQIKEAEKELKKSDKELVSQFSRKEKITSLWKKRMKNIISYGK
jgi:hypothetical protein